MLVFKKSLKINNNMEFTFETIIKQLLEEYEANPSMDVEEMLEKKLSTMGASPECINEMEEAFSAIDSFADKMNSLQNAKNEGKTRREWLMEQIGGSLSDFNEEIKLASVNALANSLEDNEKVLLNQ